MQRQAQGKCHVKTEAGSGAITEAGRETWTWFSFWTSRRNLFLMKAWLWASSLQSWGSESFSLTPKMIAYTFSWGPRQALRMIVMATPCFGIPDKPSRWQKKAYSVSIFKVLTIVWFKIYIKKLVAEPIYSSRNFSERITQKHYRAAEILNNSL